MSASQVKLVMVMVDGFGVPPEGWGKSVYAEHCDRRFVELLAHHSVPLDATLDVAGIPQSATGQTALFTGVNAAAIMRSHLQGFPGPELRRLIAEDNIFATLLRLGKKLAFANAYVKYSLQELAHMRFRSVTTVMTEAALGFARALDSLLDGAAVYHDLTRDSICDEFRIPRIEPEEASRHLLGIAAQHDFTLFEYFLTDRAGHAGDKMFLEEVLGNLSRFICEVVFSMPANMLFALCSDHGNCEDTSTCSHTTNPVPFLFVGREPVDLRGLRSISDVSGFVVKTLS